jgi:cytochrome c peroxidase
MVTGGVGCSPSTPSADEKKTASVAEAEAAREKMMKSAAEARAAAADKAWEGWTHTSRLAGLSAPPTVPDSNPMTKEKIALGHRLFMDKRLSTDGSRSCYSCHLNEYGNTDGQAKALGAGDKPLSRNSPTIWNVAYHGELYWDGRAKSLEAQALGAWRGGNMGVGADNLAAKAAEIGALPEYASDFFAVFGVAPEGEAKVTPEMIAQAISSYERTLLCGETAHDKRTSSPAATRGWDLFRGKAQCSVCHNGDNFSDGLFHNVGIGFNVDGSPGEGADIGRGKVTKNAADNYKFRTPTLRNVSATAPYFHDGSIATLEEAVRYMASGGVVNAPNADPLLRPVSLNDAEVDDLVAFLEALSCPGSLEVLGDQAVPWSKPIATP